MALPPRPSPSGGLAEIGKYRIIGQIGEGAMGVVYRGVDPVLNRPVAIKVMSDAFARDSDLRARFLREAQSAGSLQHPNVVTIYDFGEVDGHPFIAMELVEGADLDELLRTNAPLTLVEKIDVLIDVLNGLAYAHKRGIVHRDIKPANIRIDQEGRARIMDFGIAHLDSSSGARMTRTGVMVGTPAYMSPEQITGTPITASSDIFSLGTVMYELFAGTTAFQAETLQSIMYQIVTVPAPTLSAMVPAGADVDSGIMKALDAVAERALAKDPADRFENAMAMATSLSEIRARIVDGQHTAGPASLRASVARAMANDAAATRPRSSKPLVVTAIAASLAAAAITALVLNHHRSSVRTVTAIPPAVAPAPTDTPQQTSAATTPTAASSTAAPARDDKAPASNLPSARELALFRDLENTALDARRRAVEAGASAAALDSGDAHNRAASRLVADGKASEAGEQLRLAAASWTASERAARLAVASNTAAPPSSSRVADPAKAQSVPPVSAATSSAPVTQQSTPTSITPAMQQPPPAPPANPSADIGAAVVAYARALESRDVAAVRRAYPGITSSQARSWEQFFSTLRSLRVALTVSDLAVNGSSADAKILGTYDYVTDAGKTVKQPVSFQATFRRDNSVWQLASVH